MLLLALLFYVWTAATSVPFAFVHADVDPYNQLTTALLHGHTYLPVKVPAGLLKLHNPYDPAQNGPWNFTYHDLLLYHRHFYSPWGPSASLLFAIFRVSTYRLPQSLAVAIYCFIGLAAAVGLLHVLARRFIAGMPDWLLTVATIGLALTNVAPFLLRRPIEYEVAISGAYAFEMAGLYLVATATVNGPVRYRRLGWGSLLFGLALLARPPMGVDLIILIAVALVLLRLGSDRRRTIAWSLAPFLLCAVVLVVYNEVRVGGAADFGTQYQLAGLNVMKKATEQLSYIPPGVFSYLLIPAQISLTFPHVFLQSTAEYPFRVPHGYAGTPSGGSAEFAGGMLPTMPITILLLGLPVAWWRRRAGERSALLIIASLVVTTIVIIVLLSYALWGTTQRYELDYATEGLLAAFLLWGLLVARLRRGSWARRSIATLGIILTALGAGAGVAVSFNGYENLLLAYHPSTFYDLEDATSPFVTLATIIGGDPTITRVIGPGPLTYRPTTPAGVYTVFDENGASIYIGGAPTTITIVSPRSENTAIATTAIPSAKPLAGTVIRVRSAGRTGSVPVISPSVRIPVHLSLGLNRIQLSTYGTPAATTTALELTNLQVQR